MKNLKFLGLSKPSCNLVKKVGVLIPIGEYFNACFISKFDNLYVDENGSYAHDITFIEDDIEIYESKIENEYYYR